MGALQYTQDVANIYQDLQGDVYSVIDRWRADQESILSSILAGDPWLEGEGFGVAPDADTAHMPGGGNIIGFDPDAGSDWLETGSDSEYSDIWG